MKRSYAASHEKRVPDESGPLAIETACVQPTGGRLPWPVILRATARCWSTASWLAWSVAAAWSGSATSGLCTSARRLLAAAKQLGKQAAFVTSTATRIASARVTATWGTCAPHYVRCTAGSTAAVKQSAGFGAADASETHQPNSNDCRSKTLKHHGTKLLRIPTSKTKTTTASPTQLGRPP